MTAQAGWYPDETDPRRRRYWDGTRWSIAQIWDGTQWLQDTGALVHHWGATAGGVGVLGSESGTSGLQRWQGILLAMSGVGVVVGSFRPWLSAAGDAGIFSVTGMAAGPGKVSVVAGVVIAVLGVAVFAGVHPRLVGIGVGLAGAAILGAMALAVYHSTAYLASAASGFGYADGDTDVSFAVGLYIVAVCDVLAMGAASALIRRSGRGSAVGGVSP